MIQFVSNKVFFLRLAWIQPRSATDRAGQRYTPVYMMDQMFSVCSRNLNWPRTKGQRDRQREIEREMSLTKTKVHTTGSPISTATNPTSYRQKLPTSSQIRRLSFRKPYLTTLKTTNGYTKHNIHRSQQGRRSGDEGVPSGGAGLLRHTHQVWWNQVPQPSGTSGLRGKRPGDHHPRSRAGFLTSGV